MPCFPFLWIMVVGRAMVFPCRWVAWISLILGERTWGWMLQLQGGWGVRVGLIMCGCNTYVVVIYYREQAWKSGPRSAVVQYGMTSLAWSDGWCQSLLVDTVCRGGGPICCHVISIFEKFGLFFLLQFSVKTPIVKNLIEIFFPFWNIYFGGKRKQNIKIST